MYSVPPRKPRALMRERFEQDSNNAQCQKCLEKGHWTYQCTRKRKYVERPSRTQLLEKRIKQLKKSQEDEEKNTKEINKKENGSQLQSVQFVKKKKADNDDDDDGNTSDSSSSSSSSSSGSSSSGSGSSSSGSSSGSESDDESSSSSSSSASSDHESPKKKVKV